MVRILLPSKLRVPRPLSQDSDAHRSFELRLRSVWSGLRSVYRTASLPRHQRRGHPTRADQPSRLGEAGRGTASFRRLAIPRADLFVTNRLICSSQQSIHHYSTVTDFARFRGLSTSVPFAIAAWYASSCRGSTCRIGETQPEWSVSLITWTPSLSSMWVSWSAKT